MIESLVSLLFLVLILGIFFLLFQKVIALFPGLPAPVPAILEIVFILIILLALVGYWGPWSHPLFVR